MSDTQYQNDLSPTEVRQTESACDRFEAAWRAGQRPRFEDYLGARGDPARAVLLRELLILDWEYRRLAGDNPKADDYVARMPDAVDVIDSVQRKLTEKSDPTMVGANQQSTSSPGKSEIAAISGDARYEMMTEVGQGGIGIVYRCRDRVLGRELAIKVLREKYQNQGDARRRFIDEARIGSRLQHPAIVPVHEMGEFADRRPYFTMKLVEGLTLSALLRERPQDSAAMLLADLPRWLGVFESVCQAMAYAHAQGVVHRDLKPANVMVGAFGEVQVMDWGFAKQLQIADCKLQIAGQDEAVSDSISNLQSAICDFASDTVSGAMMGTPSYMPPEQARGQISLIDRRTDVFALGAMLCEILTGGPPYVAGGAGETCRQAAEGDLAAAYSLLDECGADRDLCELAKRCLACEQSARPADAGVVAKEITAHLASAQRRLQQVQVERAAAEARAQAASTKVKVERRARFLALALAAALLLGASFTAWQAVVATRAKDVALAAEKSQKQAMELAVAKELETQKILDFVQEQVFAAARPKGRPGGLGLDVPLITALKAALPYVDKYLADQPLTEARLRLTLGETFRDLGDLDNAADQFQKAHVIHTRLLAPNHEDTLLSMTRLAASLESLGKNQEAFDLREKALALRTAKFGPEHPNSLTSMSYVADSLHSLGRHTEALALREKAQLLTSKLGPDDPDTLASMNNLARSYEKVGRRTEAIKLLEKVLPWYKSRIGPEHPDTLMVMNNLAASYHSVGRNEESLALHEPALALRKKVLGNEHPDTLTSMSNLAACYYSLRRIEEGQRLLEDALEIRSATLGPTHLDTLESMNNVAKGLDGQRRHAEALKLRQAAFEGQKMQLGPNHPDTLRTMWGLAANLHNLDRGPEAIAVIDECVRRAAGNKDVDPKMIPAVMDFRLRYFQRQKNAEACRATAEMWEQLERGDPASLYMAARCRAVTAALMAAGKASSVTATEEADRAMAWLKRAVEAGYNDAAKLATSADFNALRDRADFQSLSKSIRPDG